MCSIDDWQMWVCITTDRESQLTARDGWRASILIQAEFVDGQAELYRCCTFYASITNNDTYTLPWTSPTSSRHDRRPRLDPLNFFDFDGRS
jgi:hypothetical protein